jgi:hypothetical protein
MSLTNRELKEVRGALGLDEKSSIQPPDFQVSLAKRLLANLSFCNRDAAELTNEIAEHCGSIVAARWAIYELIIAGQIVFRFQRPGIFLPIFLDVAYESSRPSAPSFPKGAFLPIFPNAAKGNVISRDGLKPRGEPRLVLSSGTTSRDGSAGPAILSGQSKWDGRSTFLQGSQESAMVSSFEKKSAPTSERVTSTPESGPYPTSADEGSFYWEGVAVLDLEGAEWRLLNYLWNHVEPTTADVLKGVWPKGGRKSFKSLLSILNKKLREKKVTVFFSCKNGIVRRLATAQGEPPSASN